MAITISNREGKVTATVDTEAIADIGGDARAELDQIEAAIQSGSITLRAGLVTAMAYGFDTARAVMGAVSTVRET